MDLHKLYLTNNGCYKSGGKITPKGIMVHSTGVRPDRALAKAF